MELGREAETPARPFEGGHQPERGASLGAAAVRGEPDLLLRARGLRQIAAGFEERGDRLGVADCPANLLHDPGIHAAGAEGAALDGPLLLGRGEVDIEMRRGAA